jgi:N-acyl homoserine lactone hydrolase
MAEGGLLMKIHVLPYGELKISKRTMFGEAYLKEDCGMFPSYGVLIEHPAATVLFDVGCCMDPRFPYMIPDDLSYTDSDKPLNRLASIGIKPEDIDYVVVSHLHQDHAGSLYQFMNSVIIVAEKEFETMLTIDDPHMPQGMQDSWKNPAFMWRPVAIGSTEIVPGVTVYNFGSGHSFGMLGVGLDTQELGKVFVVGDLVYNQCAFDGLPASVIVDLDGYNEGMKTIRHLAQQYDAAVWFGHDAQQFATLRKAPEGFYE